MLQTSAIVKHISTYDIIRHSLFTKIGNNTMQNRKDVHIILIKAHSKQQLIHYTQTFDHPST